MFQYNIIHNILYKKGILHEMKKRRESFFVLIVQMWSKQSHIYLYPALLRFPSGPTSLVGTSAFPNGNSNFRQERNLVWRLE